MSKVWNWISVLLFLILMGLVGVYAALRLPYLQAENGIPPGTRLSFSPCEDGTLALKWERSPTADEYCVLVHAHTPDAAGRRPLLFSAQCEQPSCVLPAELPEDAPLDLTISTRRHYTALGRPFIRLGEDPVTVTCYLNRPRIDGLTAYVDAEHAKVYLSWTGWQDDSFRLYLRAADGSRTPLRTQRHVGAELQFGAEGDLPIPPRGETVTFELEALREEPEYVFYGNLVETTSVDREDFLGRTLLPEVTEDGENCFLLTWNETKGARYQIRAIDPDTGSARVLDELPADAERLYRTGKLAPFATHCFEIAALGGDTLAGSPIAAPPVRVELQTGASLLGATVWSMLDTEVYSAPEGGEVIGKMLAARAYCVLEEAGGRFRIGTPQWTGYVDSATLMINLPDYIGDLCSYDVTNARSSLYMVHEYEIPEVTDTVVSGYEDVGAAPGAQLVPLLYPTAKKLIDVAQTMAADGYRIRIYDSFRPNRATRSIYDLTERIMNDPIPERTFTGVTVEDLPKPAEEDEELTYARLMTNGVYSLGHFLAAGGSMHNFGVAMDLTMERSADRAVLPMQTAMHDLSWYSAIARNNENANLLRSYMLGAGFGGLVSEWWHFQDNDAFAAWRPANRWAGVSPEGWRFDGTGWRYRLADGTCCRDTERSIDGVAYRFDAEGYAAAQ